MAAEQEQRLSNGRYQEQQNVATAPGDLPLSEVRKRVAYQAHQFRHDNTITPNTPAPGQPVTVWATSGLEMPIVHAEVWYTTNGRLPDSSAHTVPMTVSHVDWQPETGYLTRWRAELPGQGEGTAVRYTIAGWHSAPAAAPPDLFAHDGLGFWYRHDAQHNGITTFAYPVQWPSHQWPAWANDAVIYQIFLDRFHPGNADGVFAAGLAGDAKHGGTLRGVTAQLPYLAALGITCIWLSPIGPADTYHRYDATDFFDVDPDLGSAAAMRQLIAAAHERHMRVILDFVPSHCSWRHPAFVAAQQDQQAETASWFVFYEWPQTYRNFLDVVPELPSFNTNDAAARQYIIDSAIHWLTDFGFDGLRLDHVIGHGMDFWVQFQTAVRAAKPDALLIGEATDTPAALRHYQGRMSILDFPLAQALRLCFATASWDVAQFDRFLQSYEAYMATGPERVSFLDNHDMNRFLFVAGNDVTRLKLAALCQFTLSGTPVIYYGTEIGLRQRLDKEEAGYGGDSEVRGDMVWDAAQWDAALLAFYRRLIELRREATAVRNGRRWRLHVDGDSHTYAYVCTQQPDNQITPADLVVLFNLSQTAQTLAVPTTHLLEQALSTGDNCTLAVVGETTAVTLPPMTAVALKG